MTLKYTKRTGAETQKELGLDAVTLHQGTENNRGTVVCSARQWKSVWNLMQSEPINQFIKFLV